MSDLHIPRQVNLFFTSDNHFGHNNVIKYDNRPFKSCEEMDETMIVNWNNKVGHNDYVVHCGDVGLCSPGRLYTILQRLNGNIILAKGNHETSALSHRCIGRFNYIMDAGMVSYRDQPVWLSHYAHRTWNRSHHGAWHVYGHSHGSLADDPNSKSLDVGVDCHNFTPISFDELSELMSKKTFKPVDHHGGKETEQEG